MSIFTIISEVENFQKNFAPELAGIQAAEAKIAPMFASVDPTEVELVVAPLLVTASKGKLTTAQADVAVEGIFELLALIGSLAAKVQTAKK